MRYPRYCLADHQYFLQHHQRYSLQNATHASTSSILPTLAHQPRQLLCHITQASRPTTQPRFARHRRQHTTHASTPPTLAHHPHPPRQHATQSSVTPTPLTFARYLLKHTTFDSTPPTHPTLAATHANMPPTSTMLAHHPRKHATNSTYASTNSTPVIKLLLSICARVFERLIFNPFFEFFGKEITFPKSIWFSLVTDSREKFLMTIPQVFHQS